MISAVDERAKPKPRISAAAEPAPKISPAPVSTRPVTATCANPSTKTSRRSVPKTLEGHLQPDHEQQEDDARLRQMRDLRPVRHGDVSEPWDVAGESADGVGTQDRARGEEAEHRIEAEAHESRHDDGRRAEHQHKLLVGPDLRHACHGSLLGKFGADGNRIRSCGTFRYGRRRAGASSHRDLPVSAGLLQVRQSVEGAIPCSSAAARAGSCPRAPPRRRPAFLNRRQHLVGMATLVAASALPRIAAAQQV